MFQDQSKTEKSSAFRRTLNALRRRITRRNRAKPPDWFLDKFSNANNVEKLDKNVSSAQNSDEAGGSSLCTRLSVDTSLPSHYRVSIFLRFLLVFKVSIEMLKQMIIILKKNGESLKGRTFVIYLIVMLFIYL